MRQQLLPPTPLIFTLDNNEITILRQLGFSTDSGSTITSQRSVASAALPSSDLEESDDEDDGRVQWDARDTQEVSRAFMTSLRIDGSTYRKYIGAGNDSPGWSPTTPQITRPLNVRRRGTASQDDSQKAEADAETDGHHETSTDLSHSHSTQCAPSKEGREHQPYYPASQPSSSRRALVEPSPIKMRGGAQVPVVGPATVIPALALGPVPPPPSPAPSASTAAAPPRPTRRRPSSYHPAPSPRSVLGNKPQGSPTTAEHPVGRPTPELSAPDAEYDPEFTATRPVPSIPKLAGPSPYTMRTSSPAYDQRMLDHQTRRPSTPPATSSPTGYKFTNRLNERRISVPIDLDEFPVTPRFDETRFPRSDRERDWNADVASPIAPADMPAKVIQRLGLNDPPPDEPKKKKGKGFFGALARSRGNSGPSDKSKHSRRASSASLLRPTHKTDENGDVWIRMDSQQAAEHFARERAAGALLESVPVPVEKDMVFTTPGNLPRPPNVSSSPVTTVSMAPHFTNAAELLAPPPSVRMSISGGLPLRTPTSTIAYNSGATGSSPSTSYRSSMVYSTNRGGSPSTYQSSAYTSQSEYIRPENPRKDSASTISSSSSYSTVSSADMPSTPPLPAAPEVPVYGAKPSLPACGSVNRSNPRTDTVRNHQQQHQHPNRRLPQHHRRESMDIGSDGKHRPKPIDTVAARENANRHLSVVNERHVSNAHPPRPVVNSPPRVVPAPVEITFHHPARTRNRSASTSTANTTRVTGSGAASIRSGTGASTVGRKTSRAVHSPQSTQTAQPQTPPFIAYNYTSPVTAATQVGSIQAIHPNQTAAALPDFLAIQPDTSGALTEGMSGMSPQSAADKYGFNPVRNPDRPRNRNAASGNTPTGAHGQGYGYGQCPLSYAQQQAAALGGLGPVPLSPGPLLTGPGAPVSCFDPPTPVPSPKGWLGSMLTRA